LSIQRIVIPAKRALLPWHLRQDAGAALSKCHWVKQVPTVEENVWNYLSPNQVLLESQPLVMNLSVQDTVLDRKNPNLRIIENSLKGQFANSWACPHRQNSWKPQESLSPCLFAGEGHTVQGEPGASSAHHTKAGS
jgi:hypothetical protein